MPVFSLGDLRGKIRGRLDSNSGLYGDVEINYVINESIRIVSLFARFYRDTQLVPGGSVAGQRIYNVPSGIIIANLVFFGTRQLQKVSLKKLARTRRTWATDTTASRGPVEFWSPVGNGQFVISPIDSVGGVPITVIGMAEPDLLVNDADVMVLENEFAELIVSYGEHRLPLKEGGKVFADGSLALNDFYAKIKDRMAYEKLKLPKYQLVDAKKKEQPL